MTCFAWQLLRRTMQRRQNNGHKMGMRPIEGEVEYLVDSPACKTLTIDCVTDYNGQIDTFKRGIKAEISDNKFSVKVDALYYNVNWHEDRERPADATFNFYCVAKGDALEKETESPRITLPDEQSIPDLKKGHYDDKGYAVNPEKYPQEDENYLAKTPIYDWQGFLVDLKYLPSKEQDGIFGPKTETAVKKFQKDALGTKRCKADSDKFIDAPRVSFKGSENGIIDQPTREELQKWKAEHWKRPMVDLRHGEGDDNAVFAGKIERDSDGHHNGQVVTDRQNDLKAIAAYAGKLDGWFWDKTKAAVELFQHYAEKGQFLINGVMTDIGEKLTGHRRGVLGIPTQEMLAKVKEKGGKVPEKEVKYSIEKAVSYLNANATDASLGECATYVRLAILAGGIDITPHPKPAKEYGPYLEKHNFKEISDTNYVPVKGDIIVLQSYPKAPNESGHIEMLNGEEWISDFRQKDMWAGPGYRENKPEHHIYRWEE